MHSGMADCEKLEAGLCLPPDHIVLARLVKPTSDRTREMFAAGVLAVTMTPVSRLVSWRASMVMFVQLTTLIPPPACAQSQYHVTASNVLKVIRGTRILWLAGVKLR